MTSESTDRPHEQDKVPPDRLNAIDLMTRREIEARIIAPLQEALGDEFGHERVLEITRQTIDRIAREQGAQLADNAGGNTLAHFAAATDAWKRGDAMQIELLEQSREKFSFNVTGCRYAEMYHELGIPELGTLLSCNRDFTLIEGFNPDITLKRTQTLMEGASFCDFRFGIHEDK